MSGLISRDKPSNHETGPGETRWQSVRIEPQRSQEDGEEAIRVRQCAHLPHWTSAGSVYSVTFRLFDSLPRTVIQNWMAERRDIIRVAREMNRPLSQHEERRLQYLFSDRVDKYLDAGHGSSWMKEDRIANIVAHAITFFHGERYQLFAWCVMPNHVHAVLQPSRGCELSDIVHTWKSYTANQANRALGRRGPFWQREPYDHLIRDEKDFFHAIEYVLDNPLTAGLRNWKWVRSYEDSSLFES